MFTLSDKQRVLNVAGDIIVRDAAGAAVAAPGAVALTDTIDIAGFGKIKLSDITDIKLNRGRLATAEVKDYTVVVPAGLVIGDAVEVKVALLSSRYDGEVQNDYIGASAPLVFSTAPLTAVAATDVRNAIVAAFTEFVAHNFNAAIPVLVENGTAGTSIKVSANSGYEFVTVANVEIKRSQQGIGYQSFVRLAEVAAATDAVGTMGLGTGKFLEESVRMATWYNTNPYATDNSGTGVDIRALYSEVYIKIQTNREEDLSTLFAGHGPLQGKAEFTFWCNEATMIAAGGPLDFLAEAAIDVAGNVASVTVAGVAAPLTSAQERSEALVIANGNSVATAAAFIA